MIQAKRIRLLSLLTACFLLLFRGRCINETAIRKKRFVPKKYESDVQLVVSSACGLDSQMLKHAAGYEFRQGYTDQSGLQPEEGRVSLATLAGRQRATEYYNKTYFCSSVNAHGLMSITYQSDPQWAVLAGREEEAYSRPPSSPSLSGASHQQSPVIEAERVFNARRFLALLGGR